MNERGHGAESTAGTLASLRRGLPFVIVPTIVLAALAVALSLQQEHRYEATAEVFVTSNTLQTTFGAVPIGSQDPERILATQAAAARVPEVAQLAAERADAEISPDDLLDNSSVAADPGADVLRFTVTAGSQAAARDLANDYADAYVAYRKRADLQALRHAQTELVLQIRDARDKGDTATVDQLTKKLRGVRTRLLLTSATASLGTPAKDASQVQPKVVRNGMLGGILGLLIGVCLAFVRDAMNTRVRSVTEAEERLGIPLLGRISARSRRESKRTVAVISEPGSQEAEAYRMLATNIELVNLDRGVASIMISSASPREGKSTAAANLAAAFARTGRHVVLLEADLRRPSLSELLDRGEELGLTDVARGKVALDDALISIPLAPESAEASSNGKPANAGRLEVLTAGTPSPAPAEFLKSEGVANLIDELAERGDLLIIDAPPVLPASDATTLMAAESVDSVVLAARLGLVRGVSLDELRRALESAPIVTLGFFATDVPTSDGTLGGDPAYYEHQPASVG